MNTLESGIRWIKVYDFLMQGFIALHLYSCIWLKNMSWISMTASLAMYAAIHVYLPIKCTYSVPKQSFSIFSRYGWVYIVLNLHLHGQISDTDLISLPRLYNADGMLWAVSVLTPDRMINMRKVPTGMCDNAFHTFEKFLAVKETKIRLTVARETDQYRNTVLNFVVFWSYSSFKYNTYQQCMSGFLFVC
jgi:hypothetical protein